MGTHGGGWASLGCGETKGSTFKSPLSRFGARCPGCLDGRAIGVPPGPSECGVLRWSHFPSRGRGAAGETGPLSEPQRPPLYNGDKSAEPTGSLRTFNDTGVSPWPCGYCWVVNACMNSGHFLFPFKFVVRRQMRKGEEKGLVKNSL